jgi:hypothetical protein
MTDWEKIQTWIVYILYIIGIIGFGVMFAMWISI